MPYDPTWTAEALTDDSREAFYKAALDRYESSAKDADAIRRSGLIYGAVGMAIGLIGMSAGLIVYVKTPVPPPPGYIFVDRSTGVIEPAVTAKDAPAYFPDTVRLRALRDFVVACEGYVPQTWTKVDFHSCMIMATPDEQKRRDADIGRLGQHYPPTVFGPGGWAMPTAFPAFTKLGETGHTFHYQVRYERTEVVGGRETRPHYTADIVFGFHPEMAISPSDRLINPSGMQVISFSTTRD